MFFDTVIKDSRTEMQEGGPLLPMMDPQGNLPPEEVAADVVNGAPMGMVDVPNGGGPVDDGVPTELPEGTFVLNAAAIQYHGTETIDKLINDAVRALLKEGVQISGEDTNPDDDVPVAISNGEYVIPPEVAEKIGYKKLEDMNERGLEYRKKQEESQKKQAEAQPPAQPSQPPQETFMGLQMPPEQAGPPQAPVQSEPQAMAMMGMANGGTMQRTPLKDGTPENNDGLGTAIKAVTDFVNSFFGKPYTGAGQEVGFDYPEDIGPTRGEYHDLQSPPIENQNDGSTRGEFYDDPANAATNPAQEGMLQQGGFVENYTYAQPQQPTMGTPFSNAASTNSQQYGSFVQPTNEKKNSRVELQTGGSPSVHMDSDRTRLPVDRIRDAGPQIIANELSQGDVEAFRNVQEGKEDTYLRDSQGNVTYDGAYFYPYTDPRGNRTITGVNLEVHGKTEFPDGEPVKIPFQQGITLHEKYLKLAEKDLTTYAKTHSINLYDNAGVYPALLDMVYNLGIGNEKDKTGFANFGDLRTALQQATRGQKSAYGGSVPHEIQKSNIPPWRSKINADLISKYAPPPPMPRPKPPQQPSFVESKDAATFTETPYVEQFNRQKNQNANGGFIKLQDGDEVKKNLVRPREKPPVPAIGSLASLKDTPREQRFMSSQDADTQALTDTFLAEQQRGPDETELDQIVEGIAKQSAAAAVGYGDGKALYGMPNMKGRGLDSLGIASPEAKKVIETAPSFASSLSSFIPEDREGLWTAVVNMGKQSNIVKGLSNTEYKTIRHELEHLAYKKIPKVYDLFGELESKYGTPFGKSGENEETFIRVKDYMEAYANEDKERMEKAKEFLEEHDPVRFKHKNDKFTPLDFYNKNKHIFDAVDRLSQVYLKNSGGKLAGMTPETKYSEKELQVKGMAPKGFFDLRAASKEVRKLYDESIRIMTESPTSDFIQQEERSDGGFIN